MKKLLIIFLLFFTNLSAEDFKLEKIVQWFDSQWSLTFIDNQNLLITEKQGNIKFINLKEKKIKDISHNLKVLEDGQGGLLDILYNDSIVFVSYSENRSNGMSSTSVARAKLNTEKLNFKNIFQAQPPINSGYHFGSRLVIKNKHLYVTAGERGQGMIAQDASKHPGSIIRIHLNGDIPKDNPKFEGNSDWLPEIYQIGIRNPQGMAINSKTKKIWINEHGPKGGDEINVLKPGKNYGWPIVTYGEEYWGGKIGQGITSLEGFEDPIWYWVPSIAPSGMIFYDKNMFPEFKGHLLVSSLKFKSLYLVKIENELPQKELVLFKKRFGNFQPLDKTFLGIFLQFFGFIPFMVNDVFTFLSHVIGAK